MSLPTENSVRKAPANMETESKAVGKQPTAVPDMSPAQQPAKKAGRLRGGCIPCPVRSSFAFSLRFGLRSVHPVLPLHPHTLLLHLTSRRPARASSVSITCNLSHCPRLHPCTSCRLYPFLYSKLVHLRIASLCSSPSLGGFAGSSYNFPYQAVFSPKGAR